MNRRFTSTAMAVLIALGIPAGAVRAAESAAEAAQPAKPAPSEPAPGQPGLPPMPAEPAITSDEAMAALKAYFTLPEKSETVDFQWGLSRQGNTPTWDLNVTVREGNGSMGFTLATVNALSGQVLRYSGLEMLPGPIRTGPLENVKSEAEAKARAWDLVQKLAPDRTPALKEAPPGTLGAGQTYYGYWPNASAMGEMYLFTWIEYHDGVPFPASSVSVGIHKQTLAYMNLNVNLLENLKFQAGPAKVTAAEALQFMQGEGKPNLVYQPVIYGYPYVQGKPSEFKLLYTMGGLGGPVDAMTGTWAMDPLPEPRPPEVKPAEPEPVPAGDITPVAPAKLPLTDLDARKFALTFLDLPATADLHTEMGPSDEQLLRFGTWEQNISASIAIDPKTGMVRQAYRFANAQEGMPGERTVTPEQEAQARQVAFRIIQTYYSQVRDQLRYDPAPSYGAEMTTERRFRFVRYVNGLPVSNDSITVNIDLQTMTWRDLYVSWTDGVAFPSPTRAISPAKAQEQYSAGRTAQLIYRPIYPPLAPGRPYGPVPQPVEAQLVYILFPQEAPLIDALTGQPVSWDGLPVQDVPKALASVTGHWAEGALQHMVASRAIRADQLNPDAALTRTQAVTFLLGRSPSHNGISPRPVELPFADVPEHHPLYGALRMAWTEGWLKPDGGPTFRPDAPVTRAEFAVWAARALGLGDLARSGLVVRTEYQDLAGLTLEQQNAACFLQALGLLSPAATFRGDEPLTQAEGAMLTARIFNYLLDRK